MLLSRLLGTHHGAICYLVLSQLTLSI